MKTIREQIVDLENTRAAKAARAAEVMQKSREEGRTTDDAEAEEFDTLQIELKKIDADLIRLKQLETTNVDNAAPAPKTDVPSNQNNEQAAAKSREGVHALQLKEKLEPGIGFARYARIKALAFTGQAGTRDEVQLCKSIYPNDSRLLAIITKADVPAATTGNATWAGNLINEGGVAFADFVEFLAARSLYGQISGRFRRLPFDTPVLVQGSGGTAKWVKEGDAKPLTQWTYTRVKMAPLKVASIAAATKETLMRASTSADLLLRDELARAVGRRVDGTLISADAAVSDESPAGLLAGTSPLTLAGDGTVAGIRCDIAQFLKAMVFENLTVAGAFWVMPETVAIDLSLATNEVGAAAFPGITPTGGTLAGLPVYTSQYVPTDTGGPVVALIKGDEIFLGDEGGIQVYVSDQASLEMSDAPDSNSSTPTKAQVVSMWQTNSVAFMAERFLNWQKRRAGSVVWANVNWDACAGL